MTIAIIVIIILINIYFLAHLFHDLWQHRHHIMQEPASNFWEPVAMIIIYFLATFGVSDFALSTSFYHKTKWVSTKNLPGTLNIQDATPIFVTALIYLSTATVGLKTLITCVICQVIGAYLGPHLVAKLSAMVIKRGVIAGLLLAAGAILIGKLGLIPQNGTALQLSGWKLILTGGLLFIFGALNNLGIGCFALTVATVYAMGMSQVAAFPIMMCSSTCSVAIGSIQFIKIGNYSKKIALFSFFGIIGVLIAAFLVKHLNIALLNWVVIAVLGYSAISMWRDDRKENKQSY